MIKNRRLLQEIELIRALAIIIIVFAHLHWYIRISSYQSIMDSISTFTAQIGLSLFFFVSGFILYYNYNTFESTKSILKFYKKRLKRIFPLFWIAITLFAVLGLYGVIPYHMGSVEYIIRISGFQEFFFTSGIHTYFWFISIIIMYYIIYPFIVRPNKLINMLSLSSIIFIVAFIVHLKFNLIAMSFFEYYWVFMAGIILCWLKYDKNSIFSNKYLDYLLLLFVLPFMIIISRKYYGFDYIIISFIPCILLYYILNTVFTSKSLNTKKITVSKWYITLSKISTGSYAIYLFHIPILYSFIALLNITGISTFYSYMLIVTVGLPTVFIMGYYIQKSELKLRYVMDYIKSFRALKVYSEKIKDFTNKLYL